MCRQHPVKARGPKEEGKRYGGDQNERYRRELRKESQNAVEVLEEMFRHHAEALELGDNMPRMMHWNGMIWCVRSRQQSLQCPGITGWSLVRRTGRARRRAKGGEGKVMPKRDALHAGKS